EFCRWRPRQGRGEHDEENHENAEDAEEKKHSREDQHGNAGPSAQLKRAGARRDQNSCANEKCAPDNFEEKLRVGREVGVVSEGVRFPNCVKAEDYRGSQKRAEKDSRDSCGENSGGWTAARAHWSRYTIVFGVAEWVAGIEAKAKKSA